jgi:HEAT repeat protein
MDTAHIEKLLDDCRSGDYDRQLAAMIELRDSHITSAATTIGGLLSSSDDILRSTASDILGYLGEDDLETVGPLLMNMLDDPVGLVRTEATEALGQLAFTPALERLKHLLHNDPEWTVRASAAEALGNFPEEANMFLGDLEQALSDEVHSVRTYAAISLGLVGTPTFLPVLEKYIATETEPDVKKELLAASYRLGKTAHMQPLLDLLDLDSADGFFLSSILLTLEDLTGWEPPTSLAADADAIREAVTKAVQRYPKLLGEQAKKIEQNLAKLTSRKG